MNGFRRIALIGFGEVGQIFAEDLAKTAAKEIAVHDIAFEDRSSGPSQAMGEWLGWVDFTPFTVSARYRLRPAANMLDAVSGAELVISAVTADQSLAVARGAAPGLASNAFFLDLNSCSPGQKLAAAKAVGEAGGAYVEAAVMSPVGSQRIASPMLLGGPHAAAFLEGARSLGFTGAKVFSDEIGQTAAAKLCRSIVIKGIEALLTESLLAARHYGVGQAVLDSLSDLLPLPDWPATARYMISRSLEHGARRAEEMREAARAVEEARGTPLMSLAIAERQDWAAAQGRAGRADLETMLDAVIEAMADKDAIT